jgi:hypothetical protein
MHVVVGTPIKVKQIPQPTHDEVIYYDIPNILGFQHIILFITCKYQSPILSMSINRTKRYQTSPGINWFIEGRLADCLVYLHFISFRVKMSV